MQIKYVRIQKFVDTKRCGQCESKFDTEPVEGDRDAVRVFCPACGDDMGVISAVTVHIRERERRATALSIQWEAERHGFTEYITDPDAAPKPKKSAAQLIAEMGF